MADIRIMNLTRGDSVREMTLATLAESPQRSALTGFAFGCAVAFELMRLALFDTTLSPIRPTAADLWRPIAETNDPEKIVLLAAN